MSDKVRGSPERPRLCVFKSARHIYAQLIDDSRGHTLVSTSTLSEEFRTKGKTPGKIDSAKWVGSLIAEKAVAQKITKVVFDRNGFLYHGRVQALADAAREKGLDF